jgi:protein-S-isoprenylcysteine O-methyltransferase Ste14
MERRQGSGLVGWGLFLFWTGIWVTPQPRFAFLVELGNTGLIPILDFSIPIFHLIIYILFVITGGWITIEGVKEITLWASETHRTDRVVTEGIYSIVRHPQYLGGLLAYFEISFVLSA